MKLIHIDIDIWAHAKVISGYAKVLQRGAEAGVFDISATRKTFRSVGTQVLVSLNLINLLRFIHLLPLAKQAW